MFDPVLAGRPAALGFQLGSWASHKRYASMPTFVRDLYAFDAGVIGRSLEGREPAKMCIKIKFGDVHVLPAVFDLKNLG